jgi:hypothetical protein
MGALPHVLYWEGVVVIRGVANHSDLVVRYQGRDKEPTYPFVREMASIPLFLVCDHFKSGGVGLGLPSWACHSVVGLMEEVSVKTRPNGVYWTRVESCRESRMWGHPLYALVERDIHDDPPSRRVQRQGRV